MVKKVWEADPLRYQKCSRGMRMFSLIDEEDVIERVLLLHHLGLWQEGMRVHWRYRPSGRNDPRSVARRPLPRLRHRTGHGLLPHLKRPTAPRCASRTLVQRPPALGRPCLTFGPTFVTLRRPWKRTLSASDSGPTPKRAKSDFLSVSAVHQMNTHRPRVLIFVVAYEAESTLQRVLHRIPRPMFERFDAEVLVIDDSSSDRTFEVGVRSAGASSHPIAVLYNRTNQGYGGNQKLGYQYALRNGFEFVVLLHGDGQYAPESIPDLLQPLVDGEADAVFGSRMLTRGAARQGGMPLYKFVGNKILTRLQNALLQSNLSEFHSGFRAYRVSALARLPFQFNTNNFHFDTEIIIQLILAGCRIVEVSIPTYYGDEICRVNGMLYAKNVMSATLLSLLHRLSILYDRKFDIEWSGNAHYALKLGYDSSHTAALGAVPSGARVMDIGCGPGGFDRLLVDKGCIVTGADQFPPPIGQSSRTSSSGTSRSRSRSGPATTTTCCCSTSSST